MNNNVFLQESLHNCAAVPIPNTTHINVGIGDLYTEDKGSAARYNSNKSPLELLPLAIIVPTIQHDNKLILDILGKLAEYQITADETCIDECINAIINSIGINAWKLCADVLGYGAKKYATWNWAKGANWSVPLGSALRHIFKMMEGELIDEESTLEHLGHLMCNLVFIKTYMKVYPDGNDLPINYFNK